MIQTPSQPKALLGWMDSLADPTRLRLLRLVERQELGVAELCDVLQMPQSTVSRHLKLLADEGWVQNRRQGTTNLYRMMMDELQTPARKLWIVAREQTDNWAACEQDQIRLARLLRQRQDETSSFFAGAASQWDKLRQELYGLRFTTAAMLSLLPSSSVIADLGCGTGTVAAELAPYVGKVIGVDNSEAMLKAARRRTSDQPQVELRRGELTALPIEKATCDAALMLLVLTYVNDPAIVLREAARILKPGGKLVIVDLLRHDREDFRRQMGQRVLGFDPRDLATLLSGGGFSEVRSAPISPEPGTKGPALMLTAAVYSSDRPRAGERDA